MPKPQYVMQHRVSGLEEQAKQLNDMYEKGYRLHTVLDNLGGGQFLFELLPQIQGLSAKTK